MRIAHRGYALVIALILLILTMALSLYERAHAQAERNESDFVMTKKSVEVLEYDPLGVKTSSWTFVVVAMRHRATGECWLGQYQKDGNIAWAPASRQVCR